MTYDQLRAEEETAWREYQDAESIEMTRRLDASRELTRLCARWADLQRRRSGMQPLPPAIPNDVITIGGTVSISHEILKEQCPSDHHWIQTPSTPKTCPHCGKEL